MNQFENPLKSKESKEKIPRYHSRDVVRFLLYRQSPEFTRDIARQIEQHMGGREAARYMARRRANLPNVREIEERLEKFSDQEGYFPKDKLKDVLLDPGLIDEFEQSWEKIPGSTIDDEDYGDYPA